MKPNLPSLDAAIAALRGVSTERLIAIASRVNKLAKTPDAGDLFTRLNYLWKDAALSILLTSRPECSFICRAGVLRNGAVGLTLSTESCRTDVHCYPWRLSSSAAVVVGELRRDVPVVAPLLAEKLAAALAA